MNDRDHWKAQQIRFKSGNLAEFYLEHAAYLEQRGIFSAERELLHSAHLAVAKELDRYKLLEADRHDPRQQGLKH